MSCFCTSIHTLVPKASATDMLQLFAGLVTGEMSEDDAGDNASAENPDAGVLVKEEPGADGVKPKKEATRQAEHCMPCLRCMHDTSHVPCVYI